MADEQLELAGFDDAVRIGVGDGAVADRNVEHDGRGLARFERDAAERLEFAVGPAV